MRHLLQNNLRVFLLLLIAGFAVYANVIQGKFLFDDNLFIENNEQIKSLSNIPELYFSSVTEGSSVSADNFYRPNQQLVNTLLYYFFGMNSIPFHVSSILFHIVNGFLIFLLFLKFGIGRNVSFFSSLIFIIHPVNTQAVSYISGMADPLGLMFVLTALLLFINTLLSEKSKQFFFWAFGSILFFLFGIFTKENTVVFPAMTLITFIFFNQKPVSFANLLSGNKKTFLLIGIYFLIGGIYLYFKFTALNFSGNIGLTDQKNIYTENLHIRLITFLNILPEYFKMILFPVRLNYEKPYTAFVDFQRGEAILGLLTVIAGSGLAVYSLLKKNKSFFFGFFWFFICLAPVSGVIPVNAMYLEHWLYYPLIGVIFSGAKVYENQKPFVKNIFLVLLIPLLIVYGARTILRNSEWADGIKFYKNELKYSDKSARMHNNLAMIYADEKKCPLAIQHYKKAIALYDIYPQTHHNLARCYETMGNINEAINEYFNALILYPGFAHSHRNLINLFQNAGDTVHATVFNNFLIRIQRGETISQKEILEAFNSFKK